MTCVLDMTMVLNTSQKMGKNKETFEQFLISLLNIYLNFLQDDISKPPNLNILSGSEYQIRPSVYNNFLRVINFAIMFLNKIHSKTWNFGRKWQLVLNIKYCIYIVWRVWNGKMKYITIAKSLQVSGTSTYIWINLSYVRFITHLDGLISKWFFLNFISPDWGTN